MGLLANIAITAVVSLLSFVGAYKYLPVSLLDSAPSQKFGSTITTMLGSDTLSSSRSVINNNFANLNADKIEATVTSLGSLTSAATLASIGTITSGIWNGTPVTVPFGGTGSTTLASNYLLIGNGVGIVKTVSGQGSSGQFLTSAGAGQPPAWTTGVIDQSLNYIWTGTHTFNTATTTFNATTSASLVASTSPLVINGNFFGYPAKVGNGFVASSTTPFNDGSGNVAFREPDWDLVAIGSISGSASTTINVPARNFYKIMIVASSSTTAGLGMSINADIGTNYLYGRTQNGTHTSPNTKIGIDLWDVGTFKQGSLTVVNVGSFGTNGKHSITWSGGGEQDSSSEDVVGGGEWKGVATIFRFVFGGQGQTLDTGSEVAIYASSQ